MPRPRNADTAKDRVLRALQYGPKTTLQLCDRSVGGIRYSARILELREDYDIRTDAIPGVDYCLYTLLGMKPKVGEQLRLL